MLIKIKKTELYRSNHSETKLKWISNRGVTMMFIIFFNNFENFSVKDRNMYRYTFDWVENILFWIMILEKFNYEKKIHLL